MDEKDFELLEVLDETRNITHAADKLYMTQSALSKRIKSMEQELGVEILLRSRQGIRFTPAGEKVLEHSRAALKQMEQLRRGLDAMQGEVCGTLKAGVSVNFSYYRLPEVLTEYHKKYPRVRLEIATGHSRHLYQQMLDGTLGVFAERIGRQLFKLAVEQNVNNHILASDTDIDAARYMKMHTLSMEQVKGTNGKISFVDVLQQERAL